MILVFGQTGQVARHLAADPRVTALGRDAADLSDPDACAEAIWEHRPRAVINAAAWTAVDAAEEAELKVRTINAVSPGYMAETAAELEIPFVQISTDYVFDGSGERPWQPDDATAPLGAYGRTKMAGERAVIAAGGTYAILRTSWVFSAHGANFVKTMLRLGAERESLKVVADQIGGPTPAAAIADACLTVAEALIGDETLSGFYHLAGQPDVSWAGFAREIMAQADLPCRIDEIPTADYATPAPRPLNSRLDCTTLEAAFGIARPDWRVGLAGVLAELRENQ